MHVDDKELFDALVLAIISRRDPMRKFKGIYFFINNSRVEKTQDYGNDLDNERYDLGNYFLFSDEAKQVLESKEYKDFWAKVRETSTFTAIKNMDNFKAEALDLITATVNLLLVTGLTEQDFEKHIEKLESYKNGKYKK